MTGVMTQTMFREITIKQTFLQGRRCHDRCHDTKIGGVMTPGWRVS